MRLSYNIQPLLNSLPFMNNFLYTEVYSLFYEIQGIILFTFIKLLLPQLFISMSMRWVRHIGKYWGHAKPHEGLNRAKRIARLWSLGLDFTSYKQEVPEAIENRGHFTCMRATNFFKTRRTLSYLSKKMYLELIWVCNVNSKVVPVLN
jgi:hypothetical protein